jgi:hypothetical protein
VTFPQPGGLTGGCDLVHFHDVGAVGIVLGPGSLDVAHQPDEYVPKGPRRPHLSRRRCCDDAALIGPPFSRSGQQMASISTIISTALASALAVLIGDHRRNNDAALDNFLIVRVDVEEREA